MKFKVISLAALTAIVVNQAIASDIEDNAAENPNQTVATQENYPYQLSNQPRDNLEITKDEVQQFKEYMRRSRMVSTKSLLYDN